ncbi:MAG: hypothetical protein AAFV77_01780 [Planctomycetota bacterium]
MFRPIRKDTPRGKAAEKLRLGQLCIFVFTPCNALIYLLSELNQRGGIEPLLDDPMPVLYLTIGVPAITLFLGLMWIYEGSWQMRKLS